MTDIDNILLGKNLISKDWLKNLNNEFKAAGVEQRRRPWNAIQRYSSEFNVSVDISSIVAKQIFKWFKEHSKPGAHQVGSLYEAVYFYDSEFWSVSIPIIFGTAKLNPFESLDQMPEHIKTELIYDSKQSMEFERFWANCVDYGLGLDDLKKTDGLDSYGMQLLMAGNQELRAATSILKQPHPDPRAILSIRLAVEIFFKSFIALKVGLTINEAKKISHNLNKGLDRFIEVSGYNHFETMRNTLSTFPLIEERYNEQKNPLDLVWNTFNMAQKLGAIIIREHTNRNILGQVMASNKIN